MNNKNNCGIYGIFDSRTDECLYVGLSTNLSKRYKQHIKLLKNRKHSRKEFVSWWIENGEKENSMKFNVVEYCETSELNAREIFWFNELKPIFWGKKPSLNEEWELSEKVKNSISKSLLSRNYENGTSSIRLKECLFCNITFETHKKNSKFCSTECSSSSRRGRTIKFSEETLFDLYWNRSMSKQDIADYLKISRGTVDNLLDDFGIKRRKGFETYKHKLQNGKISLEKKPLKKLLCDKCNNKFSSNQIARHEESCKGPTLCMECGVPLAKKTSRFCKKHYNKSLAKTKPKTKCSQCYRIITKSGIREHEKACENKPNCRVCNVKLEKYSMIFCNDHKDTLFCQYCQKRFRRISNLSMHERKCIETLNN